ncbi:ABC transporter permease subunit [Paenibacillus sp.]|uniref:ABC transporter permease n=1 Tax=Paenibacillus sp. TaxID=58172 RepID=UPI002811146E|nr:ABC transporter permease subunit [Paenibacillus sp.]
MRRLSVLDRVKRDRVYLLLLVPALIHYIMFRYAPMFGIAVSFMDFNLFKGFFGSPWVGFKHFEAFFTNPNSWNVVRNNLILGLYKLIFTFPAPIILAILFHEMRWKKYRRFVQSVSYLPYFLSTVVVSSLLIMLLSPSTGFVNKALKSFGYEPIYFLQKAEWFRTIFITSDIWVGAGYGTIIFLAAMAAIDPQLYEAARMDGAGRWKQTLHVTLPGIMPAIVIMFIMSIGSVLEIDFVKAFLLGNPANMDTADIVSTYVYRLGILGGSFSQASAVDVSMAVFSLLLVYTTNRICRRLGDTSLW